MFIKYIKMFGGCSNELAGSLDSMLYDIKTYFKYFKKVNEAMYRCGRGVSDHFKG